MATPSNFGLTPITGVDPTTFYAVSASLTPETPAPPFSLGQVVLGSNGAEYVFVQASTSIALGDFIAINNVFQANSLTNTNVVQTSGARIAMASATVRQSITSIPAGAFFWAVTRGASQSGNAASAVTATGSVQLFTTATAGAITSVTTSSTLAAGLAGIECVSSVTPLFNLTWPRTVAVFSSAGGTLTQIANA